jgi:hypothetical protein
MTVVRLPKTKKSYHSKVVPAAEAPTTVLRDGCAGAAALSSPAFELSAAAISPPHLKVA